MVEMVLSQLIASLDMYAWPENRPVWERLWSLFRAELAPKGKGRRFDCPDTLKHFDDPDDAWLSPHLLLGQTCGWPYVNRLRDKVALVGVFDHQLEGCEPGDYYSVFITRSGADETIESLVAEKRAKIAVNNFESQSGWRVFRQLGLSEAEKDDSPQRFIRTGSHRDSIRAVASGEADCAAIDAVTFRLAQQYEPALEGVQCIGQSRPTPGLPLITARSRALIVPNLQAKMKKAVSRLETQERDALDIHDVLPIAAEDYQALA